MIRFLLIAAFTAAGLGAAGAAPPTNDQFAAASVQSGAYWLTAGTLHGATSEANEPVISGGPNGPTAWWRWTATTTGTVRVRTWGSEKPNMVAVYKGSTMDTTRLVSYGSGHYGRGNSAEALFSARSGETYSIQVLGVDYASPTAIFDDFVTGRLQVSLTPSPAAALPPPNDNFAAATVLAGSTADIVVNTAGAGGEAGEPLNMPDARGNTVWLAWTAPSAGVWQLDAQQCDFDNLLAVYTGSTVNSLTRLDYADGNYSYAGSPRVGGGRLTFRAAAGQTYRIQVQNAALAGDATDYGNVRLLLQPAQPPANDDFAAAAALTGNSPTGEGWATFATREIAEPAAETDASRSLWWRWTVPANGLLAVIQYKGYVDPYTGTGLNNLVRLPYAPDSGLRGSLGAVTDWYPVTAGTVVQLRGTDSSDRVVFSLRVVQPPVNDPFSARKLLSGGTVQDTVDLQYAGHETAEPLTDSLGPQTVWYRWVVPAAGRYVISTQGSPAFTRVRLYTGNALSTLVPAGEERLYGSGALAYGRVILDTAAGTEYAVQVLRESIVTGIDRINIRPAVPPTNDNFASAVVMNGSAWNTTGSNQDATRESEDEPSIFNGGSPSGATVWWRWTAPASGLYRLSMAGSSVNTVLGLYTGATINGLTRIAQDHGSGWGSTGAVTFQAAAGTVYHINADGQDREEGALKLSLAPVSSPPNDAFASRLPLAGFAPVAGGTVIAATAEAGEPVIPGATATGRSVWYEWTAPASATAVFKVTAARFNPAVGLFSGSALGSLNTLITSGSGAASSTDQTFLSGYPVTAGTVYKLLVDGTPAENGSFQVSVTMAPAPLNDSFASRAILSGAVVHSSGNNTGATRELNEPAHAGSGAAASIWWEWTAPASGAVALDTAGSAGQARLAVYTGAALNALTAAAADSVVFPETFSNLTFNAVAGVKYVIAADSSDRSRGEISLNLITGAAVPANDAFAAATVWNADQAEAFVRPYGATAEPGEPAHGGRPAAKSLWWAWTPQTSRRTSVWLETESLNLPARIAVYKGTALNDLTVVSAQTADGRWQRREVDVLAGQKYYIVIDTPLAAADPGWIKMGVVPVNGTADNAAPIPAPGAVIAASTKGAFNEDPLLSPAALRQLWWRWESELSARMEFRLTAPPGSGASLSVSQTSASFSGLSGAVTGQAVPGSSEIIATFDVSPGVIYYFKVTTPGPMPVSVQLVEAPRRVPPTNDMQYRAMNMAGPSWSIPVTLGAESENRLFWTWTAPSAGVAEIRLTGALAEADALFAHADGSFEMTAGTSRTNGGPPVLRIAGNAGQQWTIISRTTLRRLRPAVLTLVSPAPGTPPVNDSWLTPQVLSSSWTSAAGDVTYASCQPDERDHSASGGIQVATKLPPGRSVWYDWTPAVSGPVTFRLECAAPLAMRLYRGPTEAEWFEEAFLQPGQRTLSTVLLAGVTYHIAVAARPYDEQTAAFTLHRSAAAPNDLLSGAVVLAGNNAAGSADSTGATTEAGEPGHGFNFELPRASLWWKWTAPATGPVRIDTRGSEYDTILAVYASDPPDVTSRVAENDNALSRPGVTASAVIFPAVSGRTYVIRICRKETTEAAGTARINLSMSAPPDAYARWLTDWPSLNGPAAAETADADSDGITNLAELAFGTSPLRADAAGTALRIAPADNGWSVEATLDRDALETLTGGTPMEVIWQLSADLRVWQPGPVSQFVRREGRFSVERILLRPGDPPFARLMIRKAR